MVCYTIPLAVAVISSVVWRSKRSGPAGWWLNLMFYGAALFGAIDHLWHGELFLIGQAPLMDLLLGATITGAVFTGWGITLGIARKYPDLSRRMGYRMGILRPGKKS